MLSNAWPSCSRTRKANCALYRASNREDEEGDRMIRWLMHKLGHKSCPQCETLVDYALDGLTPAEQEQVREHLNRCPSCREQVRDFWQVREGLGLCAPECEEPSDFNAKVLARLKEQDQVASMQAAI